MDNETCRFLTPKDIADILQIGKDKAYALCRLPGFPAIRLGVAYRIESKKFFEWLATHTGDEIML